MRWASRGVATKPCAADNVLKGPALRPATSGRGIRTADHRPGVAAGRAGVLMDRICKILIVEDDAAVCRLIGDVLEYAGYEFTLASSGAEMRQALDAGDFDVAIIDVGLRDGEDGFALAEVADAKGCAVILTTGDPDRQRRLQKSSRHHLIKPFRMRQLTELVEQVLTDSAALCAPRPRDTPSLPTRA